MLIQTLKIDYGLNLLLLELTNYFVLLNARLSRSSHCQQIWRNPKFVSVIFLCSPFDFTMTNKLLLLPGLLEAKLTDRNTYKLFLYSTAYIAWILE